MRRRKPPLSSLDRARRERNIAAGFVLFAMCWLMYISYQAGTWIDTAVKSGQMTRTQSNVLVGGVLLAVLVLLIYLSKWMRKYAASQGYGSTDRTPE